MNEGSKEIKTYHELLQLKINEYVHGVYQLTKNFPNDELYGVTAQTRRSSLSVALNYVEGYASGRAKAHKNFLEISYGSLKESLYLLDFSYIEGYIKNKDGYERLKTQGLEIGAMLWGIIRRM